jgi:hypothetical protein
MSAWTPARSVLVEREGDTRGVGAIRALSLPPLTLREQITESQDQVLLSYRMLSGLPIREYTGETLLTGTEHGTDIVWTVRFRHTIPGVRAAARWVVRGLATGLAGQAERVAHQHRDGEPL